MNIPEVTPIAVAGIVFLAVFGVLIAYMGVNEDLPNFTLMGTSLFILSVSGSVSLLIDRFASRAMPKSRIARIEDGVAMRPHRVSTVRLALNALGASSSVTFLASFVPIVRVFPGSLFTMVIDVPIFVGLLLFVFFMLRRRYSVGPIFFGFHGFAWSVYGWSFSVGWNDLLWINSFGDWRQSPHYVTIATYPGAIVARPKVPRFVYHRRVPWENVAPGMQALDIQCGPQFLDVPPMYVENLIRFFIEHPEDRVRLSQQAGLALGQSVVMDVAQGDATHKLTASREEDMWGGVL